VNLISDSKRRFVLPVNLKIHNVVMIRQKCTVI
jgi:hypothetical protein